MVEKEKLGWFFYGSVLVVFFWVQFEKEEISKLVRVVWEEEMVLFVNYYFVDSFGKIVGRLKVFFMREDLVLEKDVLCECIVILEGKVYYMRLKWFKEIYLLEWGLNEEICELEEFQFYNVLWVEWREGIVY